jgi:hypothetical protein
MADVKVSALTALTGADLANGDQFLVTDVGSPNVSKSITADELAQGSQFSGRFVPKSGDVLQIPARMFDVASNAPSYGLINGLQMGWSFDQTDLESIAGSAPVPAWWSTFDVYFYWCNMGAGAGAVRWYVVQESRGDGELINDAAGVIATTATAGAQHVVERSKINATPLTRSANELLAFRIYRDIGDVNDTLGNDAALLAVELVRAS